MWTPWIDCPDDPHIGLMTEEESQNAARNVARILTKDAGFNPDEVRGYHGRWVAGSSVPDIRSDLSRTATSSMILQPVNDPDKLITMAKAAEPDFRKTIEGVAKAVGGESIFPPGTAVKGKPRILQKAKLEYNGQYSRIVDMLRATVKTATAEEARKAAAIFITRMGDHVLRVKDTIYKVDNGYRDILINFKANNGIVSELQFNSTHLIAAKFGEGHKLYEFIRSCIDCTKEEIMRATMKMDSLYNTAYDRDGDSKWKSN